MPNTEQRLREIWVGGMRCGKTTAWLRARVRQLEEENRRLREAAQALVQVLDGRLEPLHPISWIQPLEALKSTLRGEQPDQL